MGIKTVLFAMNFMLCFAKVLAHLPEPYQSINVLPFDDHGWLKPINKEMLAAFAKNDHKPKIVAELGSWLGQSTRHIASNLPLGSKVYAVDTWLGSLTQRNHPDMAIRSKLEHLYQQFLSNVIHVHLTDMIIPIRMTTLEAAKALNVSPDLIYVDASHEENDVYNDIIAWYPKLNAGGMMCGDDYGWGKKQGFPVKKGVDRAAQELGVEVIVEDNWFWYFK